MGSQPPTPQAHINVHSHHQQLHQQQYAYTPSSTSYNSNSLQIPSSDPIYGSQSVKTPSGSAFNFGVAYASAASNAPYHSRHHQPVTQPTTPVLNGQMHHHSYAHANGNRQLPLRSQSHHNVLYEHDASQSSLNFPDIDFGSAPMLCEDIVSEVFNELA